MDDILNTQSPILFDESIPHYEIHAQQPYNSTNFNKSDEIRIAIQHQDLCLLPSQSSLRICGKLTLPNGRAVANTRFVNNGICHLFEDMRYELNAIEIDRCKNVGLTTLMKGWASFTPSQSAYLKNAGWVNVEEDDPRAITNAAGNFDVIIPLNMIFGFAEDYRKIVVNAKHELIINRSRNNLNAIIQTLPAGNEPQYEDYKITLSKIEWLMPYVTVADRYKINILNQRKKNTIMSYRTWELYEYPVIPTSARHVWLVKTSNQLEKPRFLFLAFQTDRKGRNAANASRFNHCNIRNAKLFLNSQYYPYGDLNLNIALGEHSILYVSYAKFQSIYYSKAPEPILDRQSFIDRVSIIAIDCSKQNESLKNAPVDVRLEFEATEVFPANTAAYCLILHDRMIEYNPLSGDVKKL